MHRRSLKRQGAAPSIEWNRECIPSATLPDLVRYRTEFSFVMKQTQSLGYYKPAIARLATKAEIHER